MLGFLRKSVALCIGGATGILLLVSFIQINQLANKMAHIGELTRQVASLEAERERYQVGAAENAKALTPASFFHDLNLQEVDHVTFLRQDNSVATAR